MFQPMRSAWLFLWFFLGVEGLVKAQIRIVCTENDTLRTTLIPVSVGGNWTLIEGGGNILWTDSSTTPVTNLARGTNIFVWSFEENGNIFTDTVRISYQILVADAGLDQALCANDANMQATPSPDGTGFWQLVSGVGQIEEPSSPTSRIVQLGVGRNVFSWTVANGFCPTLIDSVTILNYGFVQANAGIDQLICNDRTTIDGNLPSFSNGYWSANHPEISFARPDSANTLVFGLQPGDNFLVWTLEIGNCASTKDTLLVKSSSPLFAAFAGSDQQICQSQGILHANRPTFGTGTWRVLEGNGVIVQPQSHFSVVENLSLGLNSFEFSVENAPCPISMDTVIIEVLQTGNALTANNDTAVCSDEFLLRATHVNPAGGTWMQTVGTGELINPQNPETWVRQLGPGLSVFRFLENQIGNCPARIADVLVTRNLPPSIAQAVQNINICADRGNLQASIPAIGKGRWEILRGNIQVENVQLATSRFQLSGDEAQLRWVAENENCPASQALVSVRSNRSAPQAFAGFDEAVCESSASLTGNSSNGLQGMWTLISGSGTIDNPNLNETRVQNLGFGTNIFKWHVDPVNCPENFAEVSLVRFEPPETPFAGADTQICTSTWRMAANRPTRGKGIWELVSGTAQILEPANPNTLVTGIGPGPHEFSWMVTHGPCRTISSSITIWNNNIANLATTSGDKVICSDSVVLSGNFPLNGDGVWTRLSGTGNILNPFLNQAIVRNLSLGENRFRWTISVPDCPTTFAEQGIFVVSSPNTAVAGNDKTVCGSAVLLEGNEAVGGTSRWRLLLGSGQIAPSNRNQAWAFGLSPGQQVLEYSIENAPCPVSKDTILLTVPPNEIRSYAGENQLLCENQTILGAQWPGIGNGIWELIKGGGQIENFNNPVSRISNISFRETQLLWRVQQDSCMAADLVSLSRPAFNFSLGADTFLCSGTSYTLTAPENFSSTRWNTGETSQSIVVSHSGWYVLKALSPENCEVVDSIYLLFGPCQTLQKGTIFNSEPKFTVYPNPADTWIHVNTDKLQFMQDVAIFDGTGKLVFYKNISRHAHEIKIPIQAFPKGMFIVKVTGRNKYLTGRFVKY